MKFEVRFVRGGAPHFAFETVPFLSPEHGYEHDANVPPRLAAVTKTWTLEGVLYGSSWAELTEKIEDPASYPDGIELVKDGAVLESISVAGGYEDWRIERLAASRTDLQWRGELRFTLRVSGKKTILAPGSPTKVASLDETETWTYDEAGLLTRTLAGEVEVASGSAVAAARTRGLKLPGDRFAFVTNGPDGVSVERLDANDRRARFTSVIRESGLALPAGVGPSFTVEVETTVRDGVATKTTRVQALGTGAVAAVQARAAAGQVSDAVVVEGHGRSARGVFVETKPAAGKQVVKLHRFSVSGGGRPLAFTKRTGARRPVEHVLAYEPADVVESVEVLTWGAPDAKAIHVPAPAVGLHEDKAAWRLLGPERTGIAKDASADEWTTRLARVYRATSLEGVFAAVSKSVSAVAATSLEDELARIAKG